MCVVVVVVVAVMVVVRIVQFEGQMACKFTFEY